LSGFFPPVEDAQATKPYTRLVDDHRQMVKTSKVHLYGDDSVNQVDELVETYSPVTADTRVAEDPSDTNTSLAVSIPAIKKQKDDDQLKAPYFIKGGFIPNSILIRIIWTPETFRQNANFDEFQFFQVISPFEMAFQSVF
jgi:hypothetical protein